MTNIWETLFIQPLFQPVPCARDLASALMELTNKWGRQKTGLFRGAAGTARALIRGPCWSELGAQGAKARSTLGVHVPAASSPFPATQNNHGSWLGPQVTFVQIRKRCLLVAGVALCGHGLVSRARARLIPDSPPGPGSSCNQL